MTPIADIEAAFHEHLPADLHGAAQILAQALAGLTAGVVSPAEAQARLAAPGLTSALRALAGHEVTAGSTLISFGAGNQVGDVSIGDITSGNIVKLSLSTGVIQNVNVSGGSVRDIVGEQHNYYATPSPTERKQHLALARSRHSQERFAELRQGFVGRRDELRTIAAEIDALRQSGSYLLVTGVAGQGKSSVLAALIAERGPETTPAYFIRFSPGADEQVALLRHLVAELLIQHGLEELAEAYLPETVGTITLANSLAMVLDRVSQSGQQATLVIDGLDQIKPDRQIGERDLSFLPEKLPTGVVIVLGTRPDDTLKPLKVLSSQREYRLPPLSFDNFGALLAQHEAALAAHERQSLYDALHGNAFDLAFVAREISATVAAEVPALLERVQRNPQDIFAPALDRLRGDQGFWRRVLRPLLGCLLAATGSEPLSEEALGAILSLDTDEVSDGLLRLRSFLGETDRGGQAAYYLYHLKLIDYLKGTQAGAGGKIFSARDMEQSHGRLAAWCEGSQGGLAAIWQDAGDVLERERRAYARQHYIAHLAGARSYERLWEVIDAGEYGSGKRRHDPSTRSYVLDLDIARHTVLDAIKEVHNIQARHLPQLWRYSLLRCSLTSQVDNYPRELFLALVALGRSSEAISLAELLTNSVQKTKTICAISTALLARGEESGLTALHQAGQAAKAIPNNRERAEAFTALTSALADAGHFDDARATAEAISDHEKQAEAFSALASALADAGHFDDARATAEAISDHEKQVKAFSALASALADAGHFDDARATAEAISDHEKQVKAFSLLASALVDAGHFDDARAIANTIPNSRERVWVLSVLASTLAQTGHTDDAHNAFMDARALANALPTRDTFTDADSFLEMLSEKQKKIWAFMDIAFALIQSGRFDDGRATFFEAAAVANTIIIDSWSRSLNLRDITYALAELKYFVDARAIAVTIPDADTRADALSRLASTFIEVNLFDDANTTFADARASVDTIPDKGGENSAILTLASALARADQLNKAQAIFAHVRTTIDAMYDLDTRSGALSELASALAQAHLFDDASATIDTISESGPLSYALNSLVVALVQAGRLDDARITTDALPDGSMKDEALSTLASAVGYTTAENILGQEDNGGTITRLITTLVQAQRWNDARATADAIPDKNNRTKALTALAQALAQSDQLPQAVDLLAGLWLRAQARYELIRVFVVPPELLRAYPELGQQFLDSFAWVDAQLAVG